MWLSVCTCCSYLPAGKFQEDLVDDVADFTPEQCLGLVEWREFYHKVGDGCQRGAWTSADSVQL